MSVWIELRQLHQFWRNLEGVVLDGDQEKCINWSIGKAGLKTSIIDQNEGGNKNRDTVAN